LFTSIRLFAKGEPNDRDKTNPENCIRILVGYNGTTKLLDDQEVGLWISVSCLHPDALSDGIVCKKPRALG